MNYELLIFSQVWDLSATYAGPKTLTGHADMVLALFVHK